MIRQSDRTCSHHPEPAVEISKKYQGIQRIRMKGEGYHVPRHQPQKLLSSMTLSEGRFIKTLRPQKGSLCRGTGCRKNTPQYQNSENHV